MPSGEPAIFGAVIAQTRQALIETIGQSAYERTLARLSTEDAEAYQHANALDWVPIRVIEAVAKSCGEVVGRDAMALNDEVSRIGTRRAFGSVWRAFLRFTSDEALMTRGPMLFSKTYNRGRIWTEFPSPHSARVVLEWPDAPDLVVRTLRVAIEELLTAGGRARVRVQAERTAGGGEYRCSWADQ
ncbi:MAG: hypothetical protein OHK0013_41100 [Sandaracinaceae bacterium]